MQSYTTLHLLACYKSDPAICDTQKTDRNIQWKSQSLFTRKLTSQKRTRVKLTSFTAQEDIKQAYQTIGLFFVDILFAAKCNHGVLLCSTARGNNACEQGKQHADSYQHNSDLNG